MIRINLLSLLLLCSYILSAQCITGDCENGIGTAKFLSGIYSGEFKDGQPNGKGIFEGILFDHNFRDSIRDEGLFQSGVFISGTRNIIARWHLIPDNQYNTNYRNNRKENGQWLVPYEKGLGIKAYPIEDKCQLNGKNIKCYYFRDLATKTLIRWAGNLKNGLMHGEGELYAGDPLRKLFTVKFDRGIPIVVKKIKEWENIWSSNANYKPYNISIDNGMFTALDFSLNGDTIRRKDSLSIYELFCLDNATATSGYYTKKYKDGSAYQGMVKYGYPHGYGEFFYNNGATYKGYFYEGFRSGDGVTRKLNELIDSGYYQYNRLLKGVVVNNGVSRSFPQCLSGNCENGFGKANYKMNSNDTIINTYEGNFVNGLPNGYGEKKYSQGIYSYFKRGVFSAGLLNGQGDVVANYGFINRLKGTFINDTLLVGTIFYADKTSFTFDASYYFRESFRDMPPVVFGFTTTKIIGGKGVYWTKYGSILTGRFNSNNNGLQLGSYKNATGVEIGNFGFENDPFRYLQLSSFTYTVDDIDNYVNDIVANLKWEEQDRKSKAEQYAIDKEKDRIYSINTDKPSNYREENALITCSACDGVGYTIYSFTSPGNEYVYESNGYGGYKKKLIATYKETTVTKYKCSACNGKKSVYTKVRKYIGPPR